MYTPKLHQAYTLREELTAEGAETVRTRGVAAVRPERLRLHGPADENRITGRVVAQAYHGLDLQLHVESPAAPRPVVVRITADQADLAPGPGRDIALGWSARDTRLFDKTDMKET